MNRFVNKHRIKRKYTKKTEKSSSFTISQSLIAILPIIIMCVAFLSTILISKPFRDALEGLKFSLNQPVYDIAYVLTYAQQRCIYAIQLTSNLAITIVKIYLTGLNLQLIEIIKGVHEITSYYEVLSSLVSRNKTHVFVHSNYKYLYTVKNINLLPSIQIITSGIVTLFTSFWLFTLIVAKSVNTLFYNCLNLVTSISSIFFGTITNSIIFTLHSLYSVLDGVYTSMTVLSVITIDSITQFLNLVYINIQTFTLATTHATYTVLGYVSHAIFETVIITFQMLLTLFTKITQFITSLVNEIVTITTLLISQLFKAIYLAFNKFIFACEIPFKILYAFGFILKPYFNILLYHIQMTGNDFNNTVMDFNKVFGYLSSSK